MQTEMNNCRQLVTHPFPLISLSVLLTGRQTVIASYFEMKVIHSYGIQEIMSLAEYDYRIFEVIQTMNGLP